MNERTSRNQDRRGLLLLCAAITGVMAIIALIAALYAYVSTPEFSEVPIYVDGSLRRTEIKLLYLFSPVLFELLAFAVPAYTLVSLRRHYREAEVRERPAVPSLPFNINPLTVNKLTSVIFCLVGAYILWVALCRFVYVLNHAWPLKP